MRPVQNSVLIDDTRHGLTPWLPATASPVHIGVYMVDLAADLTDVGVGVAVADAGDGHAEPIAYACWDGKRWHCAAESPASAALTPPSPARQPLRWRGLTEPSDAPCTTCGGRTVVDAGIAMDGDIDLISECPDC